MKAKPVTYKGINFRSKLEARWYNFFTEECKFNTTYEPDVEGVTGYIPDFKIKGRLFDIYVEVKPFEELDEWFSPEYEQQRTKLFNSKLITEDNSILDYFKTFGAGRRHFDLPKLFDEIKDCQMMALGDCSPTPFVLNYTQLQEDQREEFFNLIIDRADKDDTYNKYLNIFFGKDWRDYKKSPGLWQMGFSINPKKLKNRRILLVVGSEVPQYLGKENPFGVIYPSTDLILKYSNICSTAFLVEGHVSGSDFRHFTDYYENNYPYDISSSAGSPLWGQIVSGQFWNPPEIDCNGNKEEFKKKLQTSWNKSWSRLQWKGQEA